MTVQYSIAPWIYKEMQCTSLIKQIMNTLLNKTHKVRYMKQVKNCIKFCVSLLETLTQE
jgi:hypothetical protein